MATFAGNSFTCVRKNTISKTIAFVVSERLREIFYVDSGIRNVRFEPSKVSTDHSKAVPLLHFFFVCELVVSYIYIWRLFCHYLFLLVSPSFGALGMLCFVIIGFSTSMF